MSLEAKTGDTFQDNQAYVPDGTELSSITVDVKEDDDAMKDEAPGKNSENGNDSKVETEAKPDPWTVSNLEQDYTPWNELTPKGQWKRAILYTIKVILVFGFLYLFICSLDFLSSAFKLLGGRRAGEVFHRSEILSNPVAGLMMGVLVTVLVQSSSTSTSIIISMVAAEILTVKTAVPIVMGANIGTSVTNTIVSLGQITNKDDFRRAFAGATVHDMFNLMSVLVLLPLEAITGYLYHLSGALVDSMHLEKEFNVHQDLLKTITKPFTTLIIQVSSSDIKKIATKTKASHEASLMKFCCDKVKPDKCCASVLDSLPADVYPAHRPGSVLTEAERSAVCRSVDVCAGKEYREEDPHLLQCLTQPWQRVNVTEDHDVNSLSCAAIGGTTAETGCCGDELKNAPFFSELATNASAVEQHTLCARVNSTCYSGSDVYSTCMSSWVLGRKEEAESDTFSCEAWTKKVESSCNDPCEYLFRSAHESQGGELSDEGVGAILLVLSLILLCVCLVCIVKLLQSLLKGPIARLIMTFVNANFPGYLAYLTGYLAILIGAGITILVQSSSIFTSTLTPLVGMGVIHLDRMYPLTLGSNIGTTATGIMAALVQSTESIPRSLQVALCHLFFNISGIIIFYPLPFFRPPINAAKFLGNTTAEYRWYAVVYMLTVFVFLPLAVFGLSILGWYVLAAVFIPITLLFLVIAIIKLIQAKKRTLLPAKLRTWEFLPLPLRSLEPYDQTMRRLFFCKRLQRHD